MIKRHLVCLFDIYFSTEAANWQNCVEGLDRMSCVCFDVLYSEFKYHQNQLWFSTLQGWWEVLAHLDMVAGELMGTVRALNEGFWVICFNTYHCDCKTRNDIGAIPYWLWNGMYAHSHMQVDILIVKSYWYSILDFPLLTKNMGFLS